MFCSTVDTTKDLFHSISAEEGERCVVDDGSEIILLHADLDAASRLLVLDKLRSKEKVTLVCTDLAARVLDVPAVRHVILYDVPTDVASFIHQAGRTARRGQSGLLTCLVLAQSSQMGRYTQLHALKGATKLTFSTPG